MSSTMPGCPARNELLAKRNLEIIQLAMSGKYTQAELAKRYGVSQGRISQIVRNPSARRGEFWITVRRYHGVT